MARYSKNYNPNQPSAEDRALDRFASLMIDKIKSINADWEKPWFTEASLSWPRNLQGRKYNGGNALMLMLHAEKEGYKLPVWCTFNSIQTVLNAEPKGKEKAANAEAQEPVHVLKGERSFPVFLTTFTVINRETSQKIPWDDYKKLSDEEKKNYAVYPKNQVFNVFNIQQTNLQQVRPDLYAKLEAQCTFERPISNGEAFSFPTMDAMIDNNAWVCPILPQKQDAAYYSVKKDQIVMPLKEQFKDGESFYGTLFHEMVHSTGAENRLNRLKSCVFGDKDYAREELVAELGSALICQQNGIQKNLKGDSAAYLKSWLGALEESPEFIRTVMSDVKRGTSAITSRMEEVLYCIDNGLPVQAYTAEDASLDPSFVIDEVPFKDKAKVVETKEVESKEREAKESKVEEREVVAAMGVPPKKPSTGGGFREVDVMSLFGALKRDGEAKLSDHYKDEQSNSEKNEESETKSRGRGR